MGFIYSDDEWLEFLAYCEEHGGPESGFLSDETVALRDKFSASVDRAIDALGVEDADADKRSTAHYLAFATFQGHGVGLWEEREPWHEALWDQIKGDAELEALHYDVADSAESDQTPTNAA